MKYDFTTVYDRRGMDALAVDALGQPGGFAPGKPKDGFSVIPMWVADMNFACDFITRHFPGVQVAKPEGTYMLFLDCTDWCAARDKTPEDVLHAGWDVHGTSRTATINVNISEDFKKTQKTWSDQAIAFRNAMKATIALPRKHRVFAIRAI